MRIPSLVVRAIDSFEAAPLSTASAEAELVMLEESRRGARLVLPFLLPTVGFMWVAVGDATQARVVQLAFGACAAIVTLRLVVMYVLWRAPSAKLASTRHQRQLTASAWLMSAGLAAIYLSLGPTMTPVQWLTLALISSVVCSLGLLTATSSVVRFSGYVAIQLTALAFALYRTGDPSLRLVSGLAAGFIVLLMVMARKNVASVREKTLMAVRARELGLRDRLTGLRNRAFAEELLDHHAPQIVEQWSEGGRRRLSSPSSLRRLALVLIDLDHFKSVNDTHGHDGGDEVLASFAKTAQSVVRQGDVVARWGGEEFIVILEVDDQASAHAIAERVREAVATTPVALSSGRSIAVTCSVGATLFPLDVTQPMAETWRESLKRADASLYRAKALGRNQTAWASGGGGAGSDFDDVPTAVYRKPAQRRAA